MVTVETYPIVSIKRQVGRGNQSHEGKHEINQRNKSNQHNLKFFPISILKGYIQLCCTEVINKNFINGRKTHSLSTNGGVSNLFLPRSGSSRNVSISGPFWCITCGVVSHMLNVCYIYLRLGHVER